MEEFYTKEELGVFGIRKLITFWEGEAGEDFFDYCCFTTPIEEFVNYLKKEDPDLAKYVEMRIEEDDQTSLDMQDGAFYCGSYYKKSDDDDVISNLIAEYEQALLPVCRFIYDNETMWSDFKMFFIERGDYYGNAAWIDSVKGVMDNYLESRKSDLVTHIDSELEQFNEELEKFNTEVAEAKKKFADTIFKHTDSGSISKMQAIEWLTCYDLLPITSYIEMPDWMGDSDYFDRHSTVKFFDNLVDEDQFKLEDGTVDEYAPFRHITLKEAIDEIYDFIKEHRIIGCIFDW